MRNILTRTPVRITFTGGGSDLPHFYTKNGGATVNATIDKYVYIFVHQAFDNTYKIRYSKEEEASSIDDIQHNTAREALRMLKIDPKIEIISLSDIPTKGTGLGSSSAYLVGLLNALHAWKGQTVSKTQLAKEAILIEKDILGEPCGLQDQYACALGGLNFCEYMPDESVKVNPIIMKPEDLTGLQDSLMLLYTGIQRNAGDILKSVSKTDNFDVLQQRKDMAYKEYAELVSGNWKSTGEWITRGHKLKKGMSEKVSTSEIDRLCDKAVELGGDVKNIGAGAGGFLLVYAPKEKQERIKKELGLQELKFRFEFDGSSIAFFN